MSNITYGDPSALYERLLEFAALSKREVEHDGETFEIHHTQYASYDIQSAFATVVDATDSDPREHDSDFKSTASEALEQSDATVSTSMESMYNHREYIDVHDFRGAVTDYLMMWDSVRDSSRPVADVRLQATSREGAIAEVFTLMLANQAETQSRLSITAFPDDESDDHIDKGIDKDMTYYNLSAAVRQNSDHAVFRRPDPSIVTVNELFDQFEAVGMNPSVRDVYGLLVQATNIEFLLPDDAEQSELMSVLSRSVNNMVGISNHDYERWESENEPPLETVKNE